MIETKTEYIGGTIITQEIGQHIAARKYVQLQKEGNDAFVNHVGDEQDGLSERDDDGVLCFNIENHFQRDEITSYMRYNQETNTFYIPEPAPEPRGTIELITDQSKVIADLQSQISTLISLLQKDV